MSKIKVQINQIVKGIVTAIEHEFEDLEQAIQHIGQNDGHSYKVYNERGEVSHSGRNDPNPKSTPKYKDADDDKHEDHHNHKHRDDDDHDTYA